MMAGFPFIKTLICFRFRFLNSVWSAIMAMQSEPLTASCREFALLASKLSLQCGS